MKIKLFGTAAAEGWPGLFCNCDACIRARHLGGKDIRTRSSGLIDGVLKIDFPPDSLMHVLYHALDLRKIEALLFTHPHDDHFATAELQYRRPGFNPNPLPDLPIFGPPDVISELERRNSDKDLPYTLTSLTPYSTVDIAGYQVTSLVARHDPSLTCYNYLIKDAAGKTLLYASDTGWYGDETWEFLADKHIDGIVAECTHGPLENPFSSHMSITDILRLREKLIETGSFKSESKMIATHFSHWGALSFDELEDRLNPYNIYTAFDGIEFEI